jgi:hypothetical protein
MSTSGARLQWLAPQFTDAAGAPLALGTLDFFEAGSLTVRKAVFSDPSLDAATVWTNPVPLGADGRVGGTVFLSPGGYRVVIKAADGTTIATEDGVEDLGQTWLSEFGLALAAGKKSAGAWYVVTDADLLVTVASTGGPNPCVITLQAAASRMMPLCLKNLGAEPLAVYLAGSDTIDGAGGVYTVPAASAGVCPSVWLVPDGVSGWYILGSHGVV